MTKNTLRARAKRPPERRPLLLALSVAALAALAGCSRSPPRIAYHYIAVTHYQGQSGWYDRLTFFAMSEDEDGPEDFDVLELFNDAAGLYWILDEHSWEVQTHQSRTWIGSRALALPEGEDIPTGQYRAVIIDKSGEKGERVFGFDLPTERRRRPTFTCDLKTGLYKAESVYPQNSLLCYDGSGAEVRSVRLPSLEGPIAGLGIGGDIRSVALFAEDREHFESALTAVVPVR